MKVLYCGGTFGPYGEPHVSSGYVPEPPVPGGFTGPTHWVLFKKWTSVAFVHALVAGSPLQLHMKEVPQYGTGWHCPLQYRVQSGSRHSAAVPVLQPSHV